MKKAANAQLRMLNAVVQFLGSSQDEIQSIPRLVDKTAELQALHQQVRIILTKRNADITGVTEAKDSLRKKVNTLGSQLSDVLVSLLREMGNDELQERVRMSYSDLLGTNANTNLSYLETLLDSVDELEIEQLESCGWNQGRLDGFRKLVEQFALDMTSPRSAIAERAALTAQLYAYLNEAMELLSLDIDPLIVLLGEDAPEVSSRYMNVRKIISQGTRANVRYEEDSGDDDVGTSDDFDAGDLE